MNYNKEINRLGYEKMYASCKLREGFSLIELMVVIAIVAVLAAVALPAYKNYFDRSKYVMAMQSFDSLKTQAENYYGKHGTFPTSITAYGFAEGTRPADSPYPNSVAGFAMPPYVAQVSTDGANASPGTCAQVSIIGQASNFGDGDVFANSGTAGKLMQINYTAFDIGGVMQWTCAYVVYQLPGFGLLNPGVPGCYDNNDTVQLQEYNDLLTSLNAQC